MNRHIAQALVEFGTKFGSQPIEKVINHHTTLGRIQLLKIYKNLQKAVKKSLKDAPAFPKLSFTKDMWMEQRKSIVFLSLSAHYITKQWKLEKAVLGLKTFEECRSILGDYFNESQIEIVIDKSISVTDGGSNTLQVFPTRFPCQCHKINLMIKWTINEKPLPTTVAIKKKTKKGKSFPPKNLI